MYPFWIRTCIFPFCDMCRSVICDYVILPGHNDSVGFRFWRLFDFREVVWEMKKRVFFSIIHAVFRPQVASTILRC